MSRSKEKLPTTNRGVNPLSNLKLHAKAIYSNVDWLTATSSSPDIGVLWLQMFREYKKANTPKGKKSREVAVKVMGFEGIEFRGLTWAYHPKSQWFMVIASGQSACSVWHQFIPGARNITRLDIAVTVLLENAIDDLAECYYDGLDEDNRRQRGYTLMKNSKGGSTLYVGSRASQFYGRIYDKGAESGEYKPGNYWRYEVEIKKPQSYPLAMTLYDAWLKDNLSVSTRMQGYVHHWFHTRGIEPSFDPSDVYETKAIEIVSSDVNRVLKWYKSSVRPSVKRLIEDGYREEAMLALGFDEHIQSTYMDALAQNVEDAQI